MIASTSVARAAAQATKEGDRLASAAGTSLSGVVKALLRAEDVQLSPQAAQLQSHKGPLLQLLQRSELEASQRQQQNNNNGSSSFRSALPDSKRAHDKPSDSNSHKPLVPIGNVYITRRQLLHPVWQWSCKAPGSNRRCGRYSCIHCSR
eukprot:GHVT01103960.1.p2 GENE.GHVT01103960.1~~GHVT01103960.1.p2  ORF type:complete len:149 (+),score=30.95 GHVT01103960.1:3989-4435(+)